MRALRTATGCARRCRHARGGHLGSQQAGSTRRRRRWTRDPVTPDAARMTDTARHSALPPIRWSRLPAAVTHIRPSARDFRETHSLTPVLPAGAPTQRRQTAGVRLRVHKMRPSRPAGRQLLGPRRGPIVHFPAPHASTSSRVGREPTLSRGCAGTIDHHLRGPARS